jgi:hypothetical protein
MEKKSIETPTQFWLRTYALVRQKKPPQIYKEKPKVTWCPPMDKPHLKIYIAPSSIVSKMRALVVIVVVILHIFWDFRKSKSLISYQEISYLHTLVPYVLLPRMCFLNIISTFINLVCLQFFFAYLVLKEYMLCDSMNVPNVFFHPFVIDTLFLYILCLGIDTDMWFFWCIF